MGTQGQRENRQQAGAGWNCPSAAAWNRGGNTASKIYKLFAFMFLRRIARPTLVIEVTLSAWPVFLPAVSRLPLPKWYVRAKTIFILALTEPGLTFFHRPVPMGPEFRAPETLYETPEPRTGPAEVEGI